MTSDSDRRERSWLYYIGIVGTGVVTFPSCLGLLQHLVFKQLHLSASMTLSPLLGFVSVATTGIISSISICVVSPVLKRFLHDHGTSINTDSNTHDDDNTDKTATPEFMQCLPVYGVVSAAVFKLFNGHFKSVLPSDLVKPGAFARESVRATVKYANSSQRKKIQSIGKQHGCHSCGRWLKVKFYIADHQPPIAIVLQNSKANRKPLQDQRFYPQCTKCAKKQRHCVSKPAVRKLVTHATSLRRYHFFLPLPLLLPPSTLQLVMDLLKPR
ncbi:uncharacterized protein [Ptychodera flava]|uniref:uncharacterized protein n=1 Tax=Ptychodera flava TaxID=63121 RepID=UPI003969E6DD